MAQRIRAFDWSETPLGPMESWPPSLKTIVGVILGAGSPMAVYWGHDLTLVYNDPWRSLIGQKHPRALGRPAREVFPEIWGTLSPMFAKVMSGQGAAERNDQLLPLERYGSLEDAWFSFTFTPIPRSDGSIGGVFNVAVETTEWVRAERRAREQTSALTSAHQELQVMTEEIRMQNEELRASRRELEEERRRYRELVRHAPAAIYEVDFRKNRLTSVNDAMCEILGYSREELLAMDPFEILDEEGRARFQARMEQWLSGEEPSQSVEFTAETKDGDTIEAVLDVTFTRDDQGRPLGATVVAHDITERKERERRIQRYNRVLEGINRIFEQVIRAETEESLGETCLAVALEVTGSPAGFVAEVGDDGMLHDLAVSDMGWEQCRMEDQTGHQRPPGDLILHGLYGRVVDDGTGFFTNDPPAHPDSIGVPEGHPELTSFLGVPLTHEGETTGMLAVANREGGYSREQQEDLEALAPAVVEALQRKRAEVALRRYAERLLFLRTMDDAILTALSAEEVAEAVLEHAPRMLPCRRASVALFDREAQEMSLLALYRGDGLVDPGGLWGPVDATWDLVVEHLLRGKGYVVEDVQALPASSPVIAQAQADGVRAYVYEPITAQGELAGTLNLGLSEPGPPSASQREITRELALRLGVGLEQARLYEEVQRHAGHLERLVAQRTRELEASEARFRTMFEEAAIGIALTDGQGELIAANPALRRMLGYSQEELTGTCLFDLLGDRGDEARALCRRLRVEERSEIGEELAYVRQNGETGHANVTFSPLRQDGEASELLLVLMEDVTERKRARDMLIEAERLTAMGRMGASLAHEINNPLQSVVGCLGLAIEAQEEGEDAAHLMHVALEELKRAANIVHRMRDISRPDQGERELVRLSEVVDKVMTITQNQAENQHVEVIYEAEDDLPPMPVVRDRIQQVFLNLVLNAIDAMPEGGELRIEAARTDDPPGVEISFADTGVGIPPGEIERLFEAFHSNKREGLGLGLYVSRNIIQEHGGRIDVESEVGAGSTFSVWLPA